MQAKLDILNLGIKKSDEEGWTWARYDRMNESIH
jgi:hypothetical protein